MPNILKLLFSPNGRIGRRDYLVGLVGLTVIFFAYGIALNLLGPTIPGLFAVLAFPFIILQIAASIYGKRLHDIGRTMWPFTGLIFLIILIMVIVMLTFGGADYFAEFTKYSPENPAPDDLAEELNRKFGEEQRKGEIYLSWIVSILLLTFSLWLLLAKPDPEENRYGSPEK